MSQPMEVIKDDLSTGSYRHLLDAMTDGVVVQNTDGAITSCNASAQRVLGLTEEQIRGRTSLDPRWRSVHEDGSPFPGTDHPAMLALRTRVPQHDVIMGVHKPDGSLTWISIDAQPLIGADGQLYGVVTTFQDLTKRRNAERILRQSLEELVDLYDNAPCGYHSLDSNGVFVRINDTELRWLGYTREELIGRKRVLDLLTPRSIQTFHEAFPRFIREGSVQDLELEFLTRDGRVLNVIMNSTVLRDATGRFLMSRSTIFDNTQRKLAEEHRRRMNQLLEQRVEERTAALNEAVQELEAFTSSVSHDLRAPVRTIDGFARALRKEHGAQLGEEGRQLLERLIAVNWRQAQVIDDLLNLSRVFTSHLSLQVVDMTALAASVIEDLRLANPGRRIAVTVAPGMAGWGDAGLLRSVLDNLLGNAWKYTTRTPDARIEVGTHTQDGVTVYFVRDNGVGFDADHAHDLFKPFHRMHAESEFSGTGVGLATVHRIITRHGGRIWIESAPGAGTTVYFTLGARPADDPS